MMTASEMYGMAPPVQPTGTPIPDHAPGTTAPMARTEAFVPGPLGNPSFWLVAILGVAIALIASVRLEVQVNA
jgi:hypothetical protein